jgi:hypothetical protein
MPLMAAEHTFASMKHHTKNPEGKATSENSCFWDVNFSKVDKFILK